MFPGNIYEICSAPRSPISFSETVSSVSVYKKKWRVNGSIENKILRSICYFIFQQCISNVYCSLMMDFICRHFKDYECLQKKWRINDCTYKFTKSILLHFVSMHLQDDMLLPYQCDPMKFWVFRFSIKSENSIVLSVIDVKVNSMRW